MHKVLYITYDGLTDALGQSQVLPYLVGLAEQQFDFWREVHYGAYAAKCKCCKTFRTHPEDIEPKAKYDNQVKISRYWRNY